MPGYAPTRLVEVPALAAELGVARLFVKEESGRFGLPAFKVLGASYAISRTLSARCGVTDRALPVDQLRALLAKADLVKLVAATDGNHGRAVAHMARLLGVRSRIFLPSDITDEAKAGIAEEGADVVELSAPYDDIVRTAAEAATRDGAVIIQDTSWDGYEQIPQWIVAGYSTVMVEAEVQLAELSATGPDLVVVPVGVGSFAEAAVRHYRSGTGTGAPSVLAVEPTAAAVAGRVWCTTPTGAASTSAWRTRTP